MVHRLKICSLAPVVAMACGCANEYQTAAPPRSPPPSPHVEHFVRTVYVWDCGQQVAADLHDNGLYLKGTDIPFRYGEGCY
jgi:hypothetical protein